MAQPATLKISALNKSITVPTGLFINNEFVPSIDYTERIEAVNPATEEVICSVVSASPKDIDAAVAAARQAFRSTWRQNVSGSDRSKLINKLADLIESRAQELAELECLDNGKPVRIARDIDIKKSVQCLRYYAGWADKLVGQTLELDKGKVVFTRQDPIGVCGIIIPGNDPISLWVSKVAPALAVGCTIVMKPSENCPLTGFKLSELVKEAGFPPGVVNTVPSYGPVGGAALAAHPDVDKVAFTGSALTARSILEAAAKSNLKKVSLEIGGKSPHLIFSSADLEQAANWAALGIFYNSGQNCAAGSRLYVQDDIYDKFLELLVAKVKKQVICNGFDEGSGGGPVVSKSQYDRIWSYIESGKQEGAKVILGGVRRNGKGYYVDPTIFTEIRPDMKIVKEEIFGPVLSVGRFKTEEEAIGLANATTYRSAAGIHSPDFNQCMRVVLALEAGTLWLNQYDLSNNVPLVGLGGLEEYTCLKAVHPNLGAGVAWPL